MNYVNRFLLNSIHLNPFIMKNLRFNWCVWLFFGGLSIGIANAASIGEKADVQIVQQNVLCTGLVKDVKGEPVIGASVVVVSTTNGSITDIDGRFTLRNVKWEISCRFLL